MNKRHNFTAINPVTDNRTVDGLSRASRGCQQALLFILITNLWPLADAAPVPATTPLDCADAAGDVAINEIQTQENFIELYVISETDIDDWQLYVDATLVVNLGEGDCAINGTTTRDNESAGPTDSTWPAGTFITCDFATNPSNNEVLLVDNAMQVIDYLSYGTPTPRPVWSVPAECGTLFPEHQANNKDLARLPDGSGNWTDNGNENTKGGSNSGGGTSVDHYAISLTLGNPGITCEANAITITAHDSGEALIAPPAGTTISLSTSLANDGWTLKSGNGSFTAPNRYSFDGVENSVQLWLRKATATTAPHMDIDVTDGSAFDLDGDAGEDPNAQFVDAGFRFFDAGTAVAEAINHQIAGKPSHTAPNNQALQLRAVRTNSTTGACETALQGTNAIDLAYECNNPTSCTGADLVTLSAAETRVIARNNNASVSNYTAINMMFDANGNAPFSFVYNDAGNIRLFARKTLEADNTDNPPTAPATLTGSSNTFNVRPFGFYFNNLSTASDATSTNVVARAGNDFITGLSARIWVSGEDSNLDGIADNHDDLANNPVTANFGNETIPHTIEIHHDKVLPIGAGTSAGILAGDTFRTAGGAGSHFNAGTAGNITLNWNEVGIIDLTATLADYLNSGQSISSTKAQLGRFIPHHFELSDNAPDFANSCNSFTYLEQPFYYGTAPVLTVTSKAKSGSITQNYGGGTSGANGFWKLSSTLSRTFADGSALPPAATLAVITGGSTTLAGETDFDGIATLAQTAGAGGDQFIYNKNTLEPPFTADIDISYQASTFTDSDGVCYDPDADAACNGYSVTISDSTSISTQLRYGRMTMFDAYGSELNDLNLPLSLEYWADTGGGHLDYITASDDTCTTLDISDILLGDFRGQLNSGETGASTITVSNGKGSLTLRAPGDGNDGQVCVEYDLLGSGSGNFQPWLQQSWSCAGSSGNNPLANARFGIFPGNSRQIYLREQY